MTEGFWKIRDNTPPKFNIAPKKMVVGRLVSFWEGLFSGAFAVSFREGNSILSLQIVGGPDPMEADVGIINMMGLGLPVDFFYMVLYPYTFICIL